MTNSYAMTHSIKNTFIVLLSIVAILMSSYVSSSPVMVTSNSQPTHTITSSEVNHNKLAKMDMIGLHGAEEVSEKRHDESHHHAPDHSKSAVDKEITSAQNDHCDENNNGPHTCCLSLCSSFSYPLSSSLLFSTFSPTLALHQSIHIGDKMTRSETLLRPPSL
ncbi:hypothetical protein QF117_02540 [Vibrio sp. YMD68]|uniref:hypothetical protein n=1 Tax=Vibrio sp. YMD68 TaxID=3042300 RepID=UPI00249CF034|nr:hypothetical protein [Vibrio sp. YMD68]WGV98858.1 hypothetical protein QF117_02540 [Vibrio sp. YMD68]